MQECRLTLRKIFCMNCNRILDNEQRIENDNWSSQNYHRSVVKHKKIYANKRQSKNMSPERIWNNKVNFY